MLVIKVGGINITELIENIFMMLFCSILISPSVVSSKKEILLDRKFIFSLIYFKS